MADYEEADHDEKAEAESRVEFTPPKGFVAPEGSEGGKPFDLVCTFEVSEDGKLCMTKLGDHDMYKGEDARGRKHKPDYSKYAKGMMDMMPAQGQGNPGPTY